VLERIISWSLANRLAVLAGAALWVVAGLLALRALNIDAFPDTTPVQVQVNAYASSLVPEEIERQITFPIELAMSGMPGLAEIRSLSMFGLSQVVVTFADGTDIYFARQLINERLASVELPPEIERPKMGPVSTGLGEVFHYLLVKQPLEGEQDLIRLRIAQDWQVKPALRATRGAAEVNSWGGYEKQYQVRIDPNMIIKYSLTFDEVVKAVEENNRNVGAGNVREGTRSVLVQGLGRTTNVDQIKGIVITARHGVPIRVADVAEVAIGSEIRRGAVTADGKGEVVMGLGFMLMGENTHQVTWAMKDRLEEIKTTLPANVKIETVYDPPSLSITSSKP